VIRNSEHHFIHNE